MTNVNPTMDERNIPVKYRQPTKEFTGRVLRNKTELVTYSSTSHIRIWYNNQKEGYSLHSHDAAEMILCVQNRYEVHINDHIYHLNEGDLLIIPPRIPHEYINDKSGIRFIYLMEMGSFFTSADYKSIESHFFNAFLCNRNTCPNTYDEIYSHLINMNDAYFGNETFWETKVYTNMYQIFTILGESFTSTEQQESKSLSQSYSQINALIQYIDINYSEELSTEQAATFTGFSKYHFLRLFKQHTGYTFHDYLNMKRIRVAEELLATDMQVTDIAFHTGFNNLPSFCRTFKKYTKYSPSEYKKLRISEELSTHKIN